ncbi:unnamed protein product [Paramecium sonneborni]|uniref:Uncharacterized protein n=1 Tax=Paramecium sonneborni TaxID=65129 RepID=A0A8S1RP17_9CILI|nr:unnamed protein product [Paramecium sonneborni]
MGQSANVIYCKLIICLKIIQNRLIPSTLVLVMPLSMQQKQNSQPSLKLAITKLKDNQRFSNSLYKTIQIKKQLQIQQKKMTNFLQIRIQFLIINLIQILTTMRIHHKIIQQMLVKAYQKKGQRSIQGPKKREVYKY